MKIKNIVFLFIAILISGLLVTMVKNETKKFNEPIIGYRIYLEGKPIGLIKSNVELNEYINIQQDKLKQKYHVDTIYIPNDINIVKELTYENNIDSVESIYNKINAISPFTIKGYQVIIDRTNSEKYDNDEGNDDKSDNNEIITKRDNIIKINILNKEIFTKATENVILSFVSDDQYHAFVNGEKLEIKATGEVIENIYIDDDITIKEANIPVNEMIYMDIDSLSKYLIFGNNSSDIKYTVKKDDSISTIAYNNRMSVNELLIANAELSSEASLIYVGQQLSIGTLDPVFTTIVEKHVVEDKIVKYKTKYEYDNKMYQGQQKVKQQGKDGVTRVTQKIKMINGEITQAYITSSEELQPAVTRIVVKGGKQIQRGDGEWLWPTNFPYMLSSGYGWRWGVMHYGLDICGTGRGSPAYAARSGVVTDISSNSSSGYFVTIRHDNGYYTRYAHLQNTNGNDRLGLTNSATKYVYVGKRVNAHDVIGEIGSSGGSTGVHLHFEIWDGVPFRSNSFNPRLFY